MSNNNHDGMKKCSKCGEWKPATAEFFHRDKTMAGGLCSTCKGCKSDRVRECRQKNKDHYREYGREYRQKNKDWFREYRQKNREEIAERKREYRQKNKDKITKRDREYRQKNREEIAERKREYLQSPVGRLVQSTSRLRQKTGATIYVRDMTEEQKEALANQYVAVRTLEKTEKELLAASGKKRCTRCDRILDYGCFHKNITNNDGVDFWCRECVAERQREYYEKNKDKMKEYWRERYQKNKDKASEYYREYYEKNKDKMKEYYEKNKEKIKEYQRKYRQNKKKHLTKQNLSPIIGSR